MDEGDDELREIERGELGRLAARTELGGDGLNVGGAPGRDRLVNTGHARGAAGAGASSGKRSLAVGLTRETLRA